MIESLYHLQAGITASKDSATMPQKGTWKH